MTKARRFVTRTLGAYIVFVFALLLCFRLSGSQDGIDVASAMRYLSGIGPAEPAARWIVGLLEIVATILLFVPRTRMFGAVIASAIMTGATFFPQFSPLGVETLGDHGLLFDMAWGGWASGLLVLAMSLAEFMEWLTDPRMRPEQMSSRSGCSPELSR